MAGFAEDAENFALELGESLILPGRVAAQISSKDKIAYYHDQQDKVRKHWGISATVPPEASAIQATPTSFVSVTKWTRTHSNKLLFDGGFPRGALNYWKSNFLASLKDAAIEAMIERFAAAPSPPRAAAAARFSRSWISLIT